MKRLLSIILALTLIFAMLPTVFAENTEAETVIYSPTYVFKSSVLYNSDNTAATSSVLFKNMAGYHVNCESGNWKFVSAVNLHSDSQFAGSYATWMATKPVSDNALVLSLDVDKSGVYSLAFNGFNTGGTSFDMPAADTSSGIVYYYIAHKDVVNRNGWGVTGAAFIPELEASASKTDAYADVKLIASYDRRADSTSGHINHTMSEIALKEGENYLFAVIKNPSPESVHSSKVYAYLRSLKLTCEATLDVTSEGLKKTYKVGDTFTLTAKATDGSGNVDEAATAAVAYSSSNKNVATVDADGNVAVVGEGYAEITAEATVGGKKVTNKITVSIPVVWSPYYNFTRAAFDNKQFTDELGAASWSIKCVTDSSMLNRNVSTGEWIYRGGTKTYNNPPSTSSYVGYFNHATADILDTSLSIYCGAAESGLNATVLEITVDKDGYYTPTFDYYKYSRNGVLSVYLVSKDEFDARSGWDITSYSYAINQIIKPVIDGTTPYVEIKKLGSVDTYDKDATSNTTTPGSWTNPEATYIKAGKYYLFLNSTVGGAGTDTKYLHVSGIKLSRQATVDMSVSSESIEAGKSATLQSTVTSGENVDLTDSTAVTYESSAPSVAKVVDNVVIGVSEGTAKITATATVDGKPVTDTVEITVSAPTAKKTITLAYSNNVDNEIIVKGTSYTRGDEVTLDAPEIDGYTFRHWVRGSAELGDWVSSDARYTFTLATNTYLTAIYTPESDDKIVEFFNGNGEYLSEAAVENGTVTLPEEKPSLTGFKFIRWLIGEDTELTAETVLTESITRAVAEFGSDGSSYTVDGKTYAYDDAVTKTSETPVAWYRDGVQVAYGTSYTYYVWDNVSAITSDSEGTEKPLVVLDSASKGSARMIEYDAGGKEIIEVGILFGDSAKITVDSCEYKATSQKKQNHGQFTAKPNGDETVARGYLIYNDNGAYKVVYSD